MFCAGVRFFGSVFEDAADFAGARFDAQLELSGAKLNGSADFRGASPPELAIRVARQNLEIRASVARAGSRQSRSDVEFMASLLNRRKGRPGRPGLRRGQLGSSIPM